MMHDRSDVTALAQAKTAGELLEGPVGKPMSYWQLVWWRLQRDKVTLVAAAVILGIVLSAVLAPYLAPTSPSRVVSVSVWPRWARQVMCWARMSRVETCSAASYTADACLW